ncbi:hypothetical protein ACF07V_07325 [Streptomyces sp. NPDC015661]|uniref:hypothetical protein n=1 Tax=Streptomyces sp. NPDC015661 TaxID=3364961 RepID=UPI0036F7D9FF
MDPDAGPRILAADRIAEEPGDDVLHRSAVALGSATPTCGVLLAAPPASAADYPVSTFDITYGQTYTRGTITSYART